MRVLFFRGLLGICQNIIGLLWKFLEPYTDARSVAGPGQVGWRQHGEQRGSCFLGVFWEFAITLSGYIRSRHRLVACG